MAKLWQLEPGSYASSANISEVRKHPAFLHLREVCRDKYPNSGKHGPNWALVEALKSLGLPAGLPTDASYLALSVEEAAKALDAALRAKQVRRIHLAPLDFAVKLPTLSFGPAKICSPTLDELRELMDLPRLKRHFRRDQEFGMAELSCFQWLAVEETVRIDSVPEARGGVLSGLEGFDGTFRAKDHLPEALERIQLHKSRYPKVLEDALFFLLLVPWETWTTGNITWRGFSIPWVHTVDNDIFRPPKLPPSSDSLIWDEQFCPDEHGVEELVKFPLRPGRLTACASSDLARRTSNDRWSLVQRAREAELFKTPVVHFLLRGFEADGVDEFLAHITAIEASLGHFDDRKCGGITKNLSRRIGSLLGDASCGKRFGDLFTIRSEFVHGRGGMKDISSEDRRTARNLAQRVVNALIGNAKGTEFGSREDFLKGIQYT